MGEFGAQPPIYIRNIEKGKRRKNLGTSTFFSDSPGYSVVILRGIQKSFWEVTSSVWGLPRLRADGMHSETIHLAKRRISQGQ